MTETTTPLIDPQKRQRKKPVGVTLAVQDIKMLNDLQGKTGLNRSAVIRACIYQVYSSTYVKTA